MAKYEVEVELIGSDGNAFAIIGKVAAALRETEGDDVAERFVKDATVCGSYDELLVLCMDTVDVV